MDTVSVIIPVFNRKEELTNCLLSIFNQKGLDYEVIVIDDASTENIAEYLKDNFPKVMVLRQETRMGPSFLRNLGIISSKGSYLCFLDSDVELQDDGVLLRMLNAIKNNPKIGSIGGEIRLRENISECRGRGIGPLGKSILIKVDKDAKPVEVDYLASLNCFIAKETALKIGGFDPYYVFGAEDEDFGHSIKKLGLVNVVGYDYGVHHHASANGRSDNETYQYHFTNQRFVLKNFGVLRFMALLCSDFVWLMTFYPLLPLKCLYKVARRYEIKRESFTAPALVIRAYWQNFLSFRDTLVARRVDFLSTQEINKFLEWSLLSREALR